MVVTKAAMALKDGFGFGAAFLIGIFKKQAFFSFKQQYCLGNIMPHKKGHCLTPDGNIVEECIERMNDEDVSKYSEQIGAARAARKSSTEYALDGSDY